MELSQYLQFAAALFVVLVLIGLFAMIARRFSKGGTPLSGGNGRRLGVIEAAAVDGQRRLVLVRRGNVAHLLMTGGAQDLVVETGIPLAEAEAIRGAPEPAATPAAQRPAAEKAQPEPVAAPAPAAAPAAPAPSAAAAPAAAPAPAATAPAAATPPEAPASPETITPAAGSTPAATTPPGPVRFPGETEETETRPRVPLRGERPAQGQTGQAAAPKPSPATPAKPQPAQSAQSGETTAQRQAAAAQGQSGRPDLMKVRPGKDAGRDEQD